MNILRKLFRKKGGSVPSKDEDLPPASSDVRNDPNMIKVYDKYGREMFISKEEWRRNVLPGTIESNWNDPDQLYGIIVGALNDGFQAEVVKAARHLYKTDPVPSRGACLWGIVLMEEGRLDEAEKVFRGYMERHGEDGVILTNLAKVASKRGEKQKAIDILWHALELDPNQDNGMGWYEALYREEGGDAEGLAALRRVAGLPGSWRAQLWLARHALISKQLPQAMALYREALANAGKPPPWDMLMQISGDLGNNGHLIEILELVEPCYDVNVHGLNVGNNLVKTHVDLGQLDAAQALLDRLYAQKRPDWREHLAFWDSEIAKARVAVANAMHSDPPKIEMLFGRGPVWLRPDAPAAELFPVKSRDAVSVCFVMGTCEIPTNSRRMSHALSDTPGRLSRAIPLFLAEQVEFRSSAVCQTLVPWVSGSRGAFAVSGVAWAHDDVCGHARQGDCKADYVVTTHLKPVSEPWSLDVHVIRAIDGECLGQLSGSFMVADPGEAIQGLASRLLELLREHAQVDLVSSPPEYTVPSGSQFPFYLLRLEQLLAVRCNAGARGDDRSLSGERDILDGNIQQCLTTPGSVNARVILAQTLLYMKKARPEILTEFKEKVAMLQKDYPLDGPANGVVQRIIDEVNAGTPAI